MAEVSIHWQGEGSYATPCTFYGIGADELCLMQSIFDQLFTKAGVREKGVGKRKKCFDGASLLRRYSGAESLNLISISHPHRHVL